MAPSGNVMNLSQRYVSSFEPSMFERNSRLFQTSKLSFPEVARVAGFTLHSQRYGSSNNCHEEAAAVSVSAKTGHCMTAIPVATASSCS